MGIVVVINCTNVVITNNYLQYMTGNTGNDGIYGQSGGAGQNGYGIFILNCLNITITYNTLRSINGGSGGTSGDTVNGAISGNGVGIYLENSQNATLIANDIQATGTSGGRSGYTGSLGGNGGSGIGLMLNDSCNVTMSHRYDSLTAGSAGASDSASGTVGGTFMAFLINSNNTLFNFNQTLGKTYTSLVSMDNQSQQNFYCSQIAPEVQSTHDNIVHFAIGNDPALINGTETFWYRQINATWRVPMSHRCKLLILPQL